MIRSLPLIALVGTLLSAAANGAVKPAAPALPPYVGAYQPQGIDERGLWMRLDEEERRLRDSAIVIRDEALNAYLRHILCETVGQDRCAGARIYVIRDTEMNASMAPNGMLLINSGLLLRVRSEAELAAVLGHEFSHFEARHTLANFKARRSTSDVVAWMAVAGAYAGVDTAPGQAMAMQSLFAFSRDQERAADISAFRYVAASRYRPGAAADFWQRVMSEEDATAVQRRQRHGHSMSAGLYADHPATLERETYLRTMASKDGDVGDDGTAAYAVAMAPWRAQFVADQIKRNDFGGTEYILTELAAGGWTAELLMARAELYRARGNPRDLIAAADFYRQAIAQQGADPAAYRGLGLSLFRAGQVNEGRQAITHYLALKPDCEDAAMLRSLLDQQ